MLRLSRSGRLLRTGEDPVSYVNAPVLAADRSVETSPDDRWREPEHRTLVRVEAGPDGWSQRGCCRDRRVLAISRKLVEIDGFEIDVPISEHMAFTPTTTSPASVGVGRPDPDPADVKHCQGQVSRTKAGEEPLIALTVDSATEPYRWTRIASKIGAAAVHAVDPRLTDHQIWRPAENELLLAAG